MSRILAFHCGMCCHRKEHSCHCKIESTYDNIIDLIDLMHIITRIAFKIFHPNASHTTSSSPVPLNQRVHMDNLQKI